MKHKSFKHQLSPTHLFFLLLLVIKKKMICFLYLWLRWVLVAVCGPSPVTASRGFSFQWLLLLWSAGSRLPRFSSAAHGLSCSGLLGSSQTRDQPMSPALAGGFFTTEPHGTPLLLVILVLHLSNHCFVPDVDLFHQAYDFF